MADEAEENGEELRNFLTSVIERTEALVSSDSYIHHRSILLLHVDLLEKTVRVLDGLITAEVTDDERDIKALQDLKHVMNELFEQ